MLKKFKKWTGSTKLELRFRKEVLESSQSFTKLDLGPMLDEYSETLRSIRNLYESRVQTVTSPALRPGSSSKVETPTLTQLHDATQEGSKAAFDKAFGTVPLGEDGTLASYFIHLDNVVELQILLLQHMQYYTYKTRSDSVTTPDSTSSPPSRGPDHFTIVADDLDRLAQDENALTVNQREHLPGAVSQRTKILIQWSNNEDALLFAQLSPSKTKCTPLKKKYIDSFFDSTSTLSSDRATDDKTLRNVHDEVTRDSSISPLYKVSSCRSRFTGVRNSTKDLTLATLDTSISMQSEITGGSSNSSFDFPFAILQVRQEGSTGSELLSILDRSHLVERVRGFSLQYHALWQLYKPKSMTQPFWIPLLSQDIRKLPPPAFSRNNSIANTGSSSQSATHRSISTPNTDGTTAVGTEASSSAALVDVLETPPLNAFRKKRRRPYAERSVQGDKRYWSEYDHPQVDTEDGEAFVLYIDPNEKSALNRLIDRIGGVFGRSQAEEEPLLPSPDTPSGDDTSDEEEALPGQRYQYGTIHPKPVARKASYKHRAKYQAPFLPQLTTICLIASVAILIVAYILATTSKHKYATEADAGIIFATVCSLLFAVIGCVPLLSRRSGSWLSLGVAAIVLILDAVFSGFLLARMLG